MFRQSSSRNLQNKGFKVKRVLQIALLLAIVLWLLSYINKNERAGGDQTNVDHEEDVDFGRKGKAGSENVIIINGQRSDFDDIPETYGASDQAAAFAQHTEERNGQEYSQEFISNTGQTETQQDRQLHNKDVNDDSNTNSRNVALSNETSNDKEDVIQLPNQRDSEISQDQHEGGNVEDNSLEHNEVVTLDGAKTDAGEAITSDEERIVSSENQLEWGEKFNEVIKEATDSHGEVKLETEINSENTFEVEKEAIYSNGGAKSVTEDSSESSLEDTSANPSSGDASQSLPKEENSEVSVDSESSSEKNTLDLQGDTGTDSETTEHHTMGTESSDARNVDEATNLPNSIEEKESMLPTDNEVPKWEVEETNTESDDKLTVTSAADDIRNVELPVIDKTLERDAVDSNGDNASDAGRNDFGEEKMDSKSNEDVLESKEDGISETQNSGNNFSIETSSETTSATEAEKPSHDNENNSETAINEAPNLESEESQGNDFSKGENSSNIVFEDTTKPNTEGKTSSELGNNDVSSGGNDSADSWKGGKESE